ncbi:hybrid sensor histidine kinase/response regulator transcription factor [Anaerophaga thermohalophila]|uniref:hybrid sensor histidine kinase/response regulator transcription factor n=1 Tax=Anaerophaga thermohalophila TaxID=177400 RepID=UPI0002E5C6D8|nr:two-component regulator propeller domain-containing protein [Anaerophaga thermohalophila]
MIIKSLFIKGIITLWVLFSFDTEKARSVHPLYFSNLTIEQGLSSNVTNSIVQDPYGFVWIGTEEGLCRYDGFKMIAFQKTGTAGSLPSNNISALAFSNGRIWVGTWDGLCTIDVRNFRIEQINVGKHRVIRTLYADTKGNVWIGTASGLLKFDEKENRYTFYNSSNSGLSHNTIRSFYESENGDIWIGTYDGLNRYRSDTIVSFNVKGNYKPLLENNLVVSINGCPQTNDSLLWVGTETGLARFNTRTAEYELFNTSNTNFSNEVIKTIHIQNDTLLWLGTDFGLNILNTNTGKVSTYYHDPMVGNTIASNVVWEIYEDRQQRLWLITSGGVSLVDRGEPYYQLHEEFFSFEDPRIGNQIRDILTDRNGNVWLATIHGVVKRSASGKRETFSTTSGPERRLLLDNVYALEEDNRARIWIGTAGGIDIWDPEKKEMYALTASRNNGLTSNYISGFAKDSKGNFWVSAWEGGVFKVSETGNSPEQITFKRADKDGEGRLLSHKGKIFYGSGPLLWEINRNTFEKTLIEAVAKETSGKTITALLSAHNDNIWIAAEDLLLKYDTKSGKILKTDINITTPQKLINLEQDASGNLWGTTQNVIVRINTRDNEIITIPVNPGSPFKGFYSYCSAVTTNGHILFGGDNAYVEVDPGQIDLPGMKPQVRISGLRINNQNILPSGSGILQTDIAYADALNLKYKQNSLTFEFSTLDYLFPDKGQFRYRLKPAQNDWIYNSGNNNFAVFANVKPGEYTFEVQGTNHLGIWSNSRELQIDISPSIWLSNVFLTLYVLIIVGMTYFVFRVYSYRQRLRNELQIVKIEKQHSEALYQAKIRFFTNISHEFRTPLGLIISPLKQLVNAGISDTRLQHMTELAHRNAGRLYKLINQLLDFRKIESSELQIVTEDTELVDFTREVFNSFDDLARRHQMDYRFNTRLSSLNCRIDKEKVETILFNFLSNAFKYTPDGGRIIVELEVSETDNEEKIIEVSVNDTGPGISEDERKHVFDLFYQTNVSKPAGSGSGIGLTLSMEYARLHSGNIKLESTPGKGSKFTLQLPYVDATGLVERTENHIYPGKTSVEKEPITLPKGAKKLLVVDDNPDFLDYLEMNLEQEYQLVFAENGARGIELTQKEQPDLVISDVMMPVMSGTELCQYLKSESATAHIPVILLTAKTLDIDKTEGMNKGADMYITKPFDIEFLRSSIRSIFRREEQMARYIKNRLLISPDETYEKEHPDERFLKKVMSIVERNVENPDFSVDMISETLGMSSTHLYRKLKSITGQSTRGIINNYRMQKAANMLKNKDGNITEIMYAVGYTSLSSFSKSFKAKFGVSPKGYK